jgi:hypothetical protein
MIRRRDWLAIGASVTAAVYVLLAGGVLIAVQVVSR